MSARTSDSRKPSGNGATVGLVTVHIVLVFLTVLVNFGNLVSADPHEQCRYHNLHCDRGPHIQEAALISLIGSAVLILVEIVLAIYTRLRKRQRLSFVVPLLCCIFQFVILGAAFSLGSTGLA